MSTVIATTEDAPSPFLPTGLALTAGLTFEQWEKIGGTLATMDNGLNWWLGDWVNYGEAEYGEKYSQAILQTGREKHTLENLAWVASRFEPSRRRANLPWSHHAEIAALDPAVQDRLLDQAECGNWSKRALREAKDALKQLPPPPDETSRRREVVEPAGASSTDTKNATNDGSQLALGAEPDGQEQYDLADELGRAQSEIQKLERENAALAATDTGTELRKAHATIAQLEARVQQEVTRANEAVKQAKNAQRREESYRKALGVLTNGEVLDAIRDLKERAG